MVRNQRENGGRCEELKEVQYNNIYIMHVGWLFRGFKSELEGSFPENKVAGCGRLVRGEILLPEVGEFIPGNFLALCTKRRFNGISEFEVEWICTYDPQFFERLPCLGLRDAVVSAHVTKFVLVDRFVTWTEQKRRIFPNMWENYFFRFVNRIVGWKLSMIL